MSLGPEEVSIKMLRLLYQYQQQNPHSGLDEKAILERFDFIDQDEGKASVKRAFKGLIKIGFIHELKKEKTLYAITEKGIKHYSQFKFLTEENTSSFPGVMVMGDWCGHNNNFNYSTMNHPQAGLFPGETEEFIPHYDELLKLIQEMETKALDLKGSEAILEDLSQMKSVINQDSSVLGGKIQKMEELIRQMKTKIDKGN